MRRRCHVPNDPNFKYYGARGILVCDEWLAPGGFDKFIAHIGPRPSPLHTIDRLDNSRGYEPGNVRWATRKEQARNTRRNKKLVVGKVAMLLDDWAKKTGISRNTITSRLRQGWPADLAVTTPVVGTGFRLKTRPKKETPVKPKIKPRSVVFPIRISAAEKRALIKAAAVAKKRPSAFVRDLLLAHLTPAVTPAASHS